MSAERTGKIIAGLSCVWGVLFLLTAATIQQGLTATVFGFTGLGLLGVGVSAAVVGAVCS